MSAARLHDAIRTLAAWTRRPERWWVRRPDAAMLAGAALAAVLVGALVASPRTFGPSYRYAVGDFAAATIRAPWDLSVPDDEATSRLRDEAARYTAPVASLDEGTPARVQERITAVFVRARTALADADGRRVLSDREASTSSAARRRRLAEIRGREADQAVLAVVQQALGELEVQLGIALTPEERTVIGEGRFREAVDSGLLALLREAHARPIAHDLAALRAAATGSQRPGEPARVVLRAGPPVQDRVWQDAALLDDIAGAISRIRVRAPYLMPGVAGAERDVLVGLAARLVTATTALDVAATAERRARAAADVLPVSLHFRRNELIVGEGREVSREALLVLDYLQRQGLPRALLGRAGGAALVTLLLLAAVLWLPVQLGYPPARWRDAAFILAVVVAATASFRLWLTVADGVAVRAPGAPRVAILLLYPASAAPMLAGLVLPRRLVAGVVMTLAVVAGLLTDLGVVYAAHALTVGLAGAQLAYPCRQRSGVIRAGVWTGAVAAASSPAVLVLAAVGGGVWHAALSMAGAFAGAAGGALVALAFSRPVEWAFGYATKLRLVELLSYDHPLLRRFMERAPGTFQHSVAVALLARSAAEAIGADPLLVRVGALYHDVGKMEAPQYFAENQRGGNPHDNLDPAVSARLIVGHVEQGVDLLTRYGVGERIADFAREHQGTGALTGFLRKAQARGGAVDPADYRYAGPRPRSRETAVLMIADKVEATARARGAASEDEFRAVVDRTIDELQADGQFDESPLTLRDLSTLRRAFVSALIDAHHRRVPYPDPPGPRATTAADEPVVRP